MAADDQPESDPSPGSNRQPGRGPNPESSRESSGARVEAAASVRRLIHGLVGHDGPEIDLAEVARQAGELADRLERGPRRVRPEGNMVRYPQPVADGAELTCWQDCMIAGEAHPQGTGLEAYRDGDEAVAQVELGPAHEGPPGRAHGGMVASLFDEVMGFALWMDSVPAYTAWLRVDYRRPMPLAEPIELRASISGRERRKLFLTSTARSNGEILAEAEALFVIPKDLGPH
ncbi:MAG: PaaI family thioesterase [Acidimicrobiales bacterium]